MILPAAGFRALGSARAVLRCGGVDRLAAVLRRDGDMLGTWTRENGLCFDRNTLRCGDALQTHVLGPGRRIGRD